MDVSNTAKNNPTIKLSWDYEPVKYKNFTDLGNYLIRINDADIADFDFASKIIAADNDPFKPTCTCTVKRNSKGEVIIGRNMDIEISQNPAFITRVRGGKYEAVNIGYSGTAGKYRYDQLDQIDSDEDFCTKQVFISTDAINEVGLYLETDIRENDTAYDLACTGTNPGKQRACLASAAILAVANCATVPEAVEYFNNSYDWYAAGADFGTHKVLWNIAFIAGDAQGNYGLIEFAMNKVFYTPYANGHANYYVHPAIAEYAVEGSGFGRLAAALEGLPECETEQDMMKNMESCMWKREILDPGCLGYSDIITNVNERRATPQEEMQAMIEAKMEPVRPLAEAFYAGDEKPLRDSGAVWTTGLNVGVNCATKHLILRLWENSDVIVNVQW